MQKYRWGLALAAEAQPLTQLEELIRLHPPDPSAVMGEREGRGEREYCGAWTVGHWGAKFQARSNLH